MKNFLNSSAFFPICFLNLAVQKSGINLKKNTISKCFYIRAANSNGLVCVATHASVYDHEVLVGLHCSWHAGMLVDGVDAMLVCCWNDAACGLYPSRRNRIENKKLSNPIKYLLGSRISMFVM